LLRNAGHLGEALLGEAFDKAPDYGIFTGATEFGAAWKKTSGAGREYVSVKLDDPSFPAPIFASLLPLPERIESTGLR
jgi:uncharacterized protein (DUF736 family)